MFSAPERAGVSSVRHGNLARPGRRAAVWVISEICGLIVSSERINLGDWLALRVTRNSCSEPKLTACIPRSPARSQSAPPKSPMPTQTKARTVPGSDNFVRRHVGPGEADVAKMLDVLGHDSL